MEIVPYLHLISGQRSNIYLWLGDGGPLMVDAGMPKDQKAIISYLSKISLPVTALKAIFITHADLDHIGAAAAVQTQSGAKLYCGSLTATLLQNGKFPKHMPWLVQFIIDNFMSYEPVSEAAVQLLVDGESMVESSDWQALASPGHTMDHFSLYSKVNGILFAGDALSTRDNRLQCTPKRITADWGEAVSSARRLLVRHPGVFACGHGEPFVNYEASDVMSLYRELG